MHGTHCTTQRRGRGVVEGISEGEGSAIIPVPTPTGAIPPLRPIVDGAIPMQAGVTSRAVAGTQAIITQDGEEVTTRDGEAMPITGVINQSTTTPGATSLPITTGEAATPTADGETQWVVWVVWEVLLAQATPLAISHLLKN